MSRKPSEVVVGDRGRVVLPAALRSELGLTPGTRMLASAEPDGSLHLRPYRAVAEAGRGMLKHLAPPEVSMVDDLLAERRRETQREDEE